VDWVTNAVRLNFGESLIYHREAGAMILERLPNTLQLALTALLLQLVIGVPLGVIAALKRGTWRDGVIRVFGVAGHAVPAFWLGQVLIILFAISLHWLPTQGMLTVGKDQMDIPDRLKHIALPAFVLALAGIANYSRILRTETLDVLGQDFIRTAHAKGLHERVVVYVHALRNALIPVVTVAGLQFGQLLAGAALTETVFNWPGIGRLAVDAAFSRDYPVSMGLLVIASALVVVGNTLSDILYTLVDPRIKFS